MTLEDIVSHTDDSRCAPLPRPVLARVEKGGIAFWTDQELAARGVVVAFSERGGGVSSPPFESLNLATHVGDEAMDVDENRSRFFSAIGLEHLRDRLVTAEQVHGAHISEARGSHAGRGARASQGSGPIAGTDALLTREPALPLLLMYADCVPVILVAPPATGACVVHAGWRGALASLPGKAAHELAQLAGCELEQIVAYVGPHVRACHYAVDDELLSQFTDTFGTVSRADSGGLDLAAVVTASLTRSGVDPCHIARLEACTAETTDRFFSYRAEGGVTGRHGALVCILP